MTTTQQHEQIMRATPDELDTLVKMSIGRIFKLMSRPFQEGDIEQFEKAKSVIMSCAEALGMSNDYSSELVANHRPGWNFGNSCID